MYLRQKNQEITYKEGTYRLKSKKSLMSHKYPAENARNTVPAMSLENETSQVRYS